MISLHFAISVAVVCLALAIASNFVPESVGYSLACASFVIVAIYGLVVAFWFSGICLEADAAFQASYRTGTQRAGDL